MQQLGSSENYTATVVVLLHASAALYGPSRALVLPVGHQYVPGPQQQQGGHLR